MGSQKCKPYLILLELRITKPSIARGCDSNWQKADFVWQHCSTQSLPDSEIKPPNETHMEKINIEEKLSLISEHWKPHIAGELNGQYVKLVKFQGRFTWHHHRNEDEMFLVVKGRFR